MKNKFAKHIKKEAAIESVKTMFVNNPEDVLTLDQVYTAWGRDLTKVDKNRAWFYNKSVDLRYHNLITPIYTTRNNKRVLDKIQLTMEGKRAIGRIGESPTNEGTSTEKKNGQITLEDIMKIIPKLKKENPDFNITFSVTPKEG